MTHMDYKRTGKMHSFRGLLTDGEQEKIRIQGPVGAVAWRITKLQVMTHTPGGANSVESVIKIYREEQSAVDTTVNFNDDELLAAAVWSSASTLYNNPEDMSVIFDNALFSRNIYVTHSETQNNEACNYYIELEEVKVSKAGMAQLAVAAARRTID